MIRTKIEQTANELLDRFDVQSPPVPIERIAKGFGAIVVRNKFSGPESGFALSRGTEKIIGVNASTAASRQNFTIAHELGHLILHHKPLIVDHQILVSRRNDVSSFGTDEEEIEANAFAASILMPETMVRSYLAQYTGSGGLPDREILIKRLATRFSVSVDAMGFRLINLSLITGGL